MKILDKITLVLFSIIILTLSIVIILLMFGWINFYALSTLYSEIIANSIASNVIIGVTIVCALLSLKAIFFGSTNAVSGEGILLENEARKTYDI